MLDLTDLAEVDLPMELAAVRRDVEVGDRVDLRVAASASRAPTIVEAAAFGVDVVTPGRITATAVRALPDHVGPDMRLLCCGLNPSLHAADAGVGYVTGSNRFWRAMVAAGLATHERDNVHLLRHHHIGMTDLVRRPTARADEVSAAEYQAGFEQLAQLCAWLRPRAVAMVGLHGWRLAVDRKATVGWQAQAAGGAPVYVLPSTSGLNARVPLAELVDHLRAAADGPTP